MVDDAYNAYVDKDFKFMGKLIDSYWRIKTQLDPNSANEFIYKAYSDCRLSGAWGGKMDENTMIILAPKEKHEGICAIMKDHIKLKSSVNTTGIVREELFSGNSNCCK
jgi:galactokinase/mevalonate kinase-like predicted kinase